MKRYNIIIFLLFLISEMSGENFVLSDAEHKCGTFASAEQQSKLFKRLMFPVDTIIGRPQLQKQVQSLSGKFLVHYDTIGYHSVDLSDNNANGIPDYVDSTAYYFDIAYKFYIDTIGYIKPLEDEDLGGSSAYDIYIMNIGDGEPAYYGVTRHDKEKLPRQKFPRWITHIFVDNDYSPLDSTNDSYGRRKQTFKIFGIDLLKITAVHEFHHAIQLTYGEQEIPNPLTINEMTSTWMEYRLFPEIKDYLQYVNGLFMYPEDCPFGSGTPENGYRWSIFGHYIYKNFGDSLLLRMWEKVGEGINAYEALNSAFEEQGTNIKTVWCDFLPWLYYTNERAVDGEYFEDAKLFPEFSFNRKENFISPAFIDEGNLQSFEVRAFQCILPTQENNSLDTLSIFIANTDLQSAVRQYESNKPYSLILSDFENSECQQITGTKYFYGVKALKGDICDKTFFVMSNPIGYVYPNPFKPSEDKFLFFPVPDNAIISDNALLTIYSNDMINRYSKKRQVVVNNTFRDGEKNDRVLQVDTAELNELSSGVYIFSVDYKGKLTFGKFVIIRK
ncbi:MAG: MXAN_6640 family putative metalloprotease [bacterium]